jgi:hypothetical protein
MKRIVSLTVISVALVLLFTACAPAAGRAIIQYQASAEDIIGAVAEIGVTLQPDPGYNFFSINAIGERFITLQANTTTGISILFGGSNLVLNFSAVQNGDIVSLAASGQGNGGLVNDSIDKITQQLDVRFTRVK